MDEGYKIYFDNFGSSNFLNHICSNSYFFNDLFRYSDNEVILQNILRLFKRLVKYLNKVCIWKYSFKNVSFFKCKLFKKIKRIEELEEEE